jgi:hypothetical protein
MVDIGSQPLQLHNSADAGKLVANKPWALLNLGSRDAVCLIVCLLNATAYFHDADLF